MTELDGTSLDAIVRVIQSSLAPVFFLTAVASLLGVFTTRLARVADQVKLVGENSGAEPAIRRRLRTLRLRSSLLDAAVILGAFAGVCVTCTVLVLFLGLVRAQATILPLVVLFGVAVFCTIGALSAFMFEVLIASRHVRAEVDRKAEKAEFLS